MQKWTPSLMGKKGGKSRSAAKLAGAARAREIAAARRESLAAKPPANFAELVPK